MNQKHMDEAWTGAIQALRAFLQTHNEISHAAIMSDLFGHIRIIIWPSLQDTDKAELQSALAEASGNWWTGDLFEGNNENPVHPLAWEEGTRDRQMPQKLRLLERHRNRGAWFTKMGDPPWKTAGTVRSDGPPIIIFYSFKGGLGRSTALVSFALQRARIGERVAVLDFDLDAPGLGNLLAADEDGRTSPWGVVDFLLESETPAPLSDYYHPCKRKGASGRQDIVGDGEILVFPAGNIDDRYPGKLARIDLEPAHNDTAATSIVKLLKHVKEDVRPNWILLDARTGLSELSGALLSGIGHLHVLFGTTSEQSWAGLKLVIKRLGADRVLENNPQTDCIVVQSMVPADTVIAKEATASFALRAEDEFRELYYATPTTEDIESDTLWDLEDMGADDAPHVPEHLIYQPRLAHIRDISDVAELLTEDPEYRRLGTRIADRFQESEDE